MTHAVFKGRDMSKNKEIGSEFWLEHEPTSICNDRDGIYVLSGRTAIDLIIQDILSHKQIESVYLPAYCCDSMILPFTKRGIKVDLYDVGVDGDLHFYIDEDFKCDVLYLTNYFGYHTSVDSNTINVFRERGTIIIYDKTHSFLMNNDDIEYDYSFASIRKWMGVVSGAVVEGVKNVCLKKYPYLSCREGAMRQKKLFIEGDDSVSKDVFLNLYNEFNIHLQNEYIDYEMDELSYSIYKTIDLDIIRNCRIENVKFLHDNLKGVDFLCRLTDDACPLFVPVIFKSKDERNAVRKKLIDNQIYCPIHWPKNQLITSGMKVNNIFDRELSLICDQRYTVDEMTTIVNMINQ